MNKRHSRRQSTHCRPIDIRHHSSRSRDGTGQRRGVDARIIFIFQYLAHHCACHTRYWEGHRRQTGNRIAIAVFGAELQHRDCFPVSLNRVGLNGKARFIAIHDSRINNNCNMLGRRSVSFYIICGYAKVIRILCCRPRLINRQHDVILLFTDLGNLPSICKQRGVIPFNATEGIS